MGLRLWELEKDGNVQLFAWVRGEIGNPTQKESCLRWPWYCLEPRSTGHLLLAFGRGQGKGKYVKPPVVSDLVPKNYTCL